MEIQKKVKCRREKCNQRAVGKSEGDGAFNKYIYRCAEHPFKRSRFIKKTDFNERGFEPDYSQRPKPYSARPVAACFECGKEQYKGRYKMCLCAGETHKRRGLV